MATASSEVRIDIPSIQPMAVEEHCCSCCCKDRQVRWQQGVSISGIAFDAAAIATTALKISSIWGTISTAGISAGIHGFATLALYIWQPRRALEKTVAQAGKVDEELGQRLKDMEEAFQNLSITSEAQKKELAEEKQFAKQFQTAADERIQQIMSLSEELTAAKKGLEEARLLANKWQQATTQLTTQIAKFTPDQLVGSVQEISRKMQTLHETQALFSHEVDALEEQAGAVKATQEIWGKMILQVQQTFQGLSTDLVAKQTLLREAETEIDKLKREVETLQGIKIDFDKMQERYAALTRELQVANEQMAQLLPIMENPEFMATVKRLISGLK